MKAAFKFAILLVAFPCMFISMGSYALVDEINAWIKEDSFWAYYILKWLIVFLSSPFKMVSSFFNYE